MLLISFCACNTSKKILYLQDVSVNQTDTITNNNAIIRIQPNDMISIVVSSKDAELAVLFNLTRIAYSSGVTELGSANNNQISGYVVDDDGNIDFPVLGSIHVKGLTRRELSVLIKEKLINDNLLKDPVVSVDFLNLSVSVLGEVKSPGKFLLNKDQVSLMEVLSMAGDLTIFGKRDNVLVIREKDGKRTIYSVDLKSADVFSSPAYYLQQNDVVYVQPNNVRAGQSTINENNVKSVSLWVSVASFLTSVTILIHNLN